MKFRRITTATLVVSLALPTFAGIGSKEAAFRGGTITTIKDGMETQLTLGAEALQFHTLKIPYAQIEELEYGQKAGRRVGAAIALGVTTLGVGALPILFSKKRKHYLTVNYNDGTANQAVVFELGKDMVRQAITTLQTRTGKKVQFQDEEARKHFAN